MREFGLGAAGGAQLCFANKKRRSHIRAIAYKPLENHGHSESTVVAQRLPVLKFFAKSIGWIFLLVIGFGIAVAGLGMLAGMLGMVITYGIPLAIGTFIVGSVMYVLWGLLFGKD